MREAAKQPKRAPSSALPERQVEFVEPKDGVFRTYANYHGLGWTVYDVRLLFGELIDVLPEKFIIEEVAHVTLSWQQAKLLSNGLSEIIRKYEAANGPLEPIKVP